MFDGDRKSFQERVIERLDFLKSVGLWPNVSNLDYKAWVENFIKNEKAYAYRLLEKFIYINEDVSNHLLEAALLSLGGDVLNYEHDNDIGASWKDFVEKLIFCAVRGEKPNETDSGFSYLRTARKRFKIQEDNIFNNEELLIKLYRECKSGVIEKDVVFVDDFIGTGNQFLSTWFRVVKIKDGDEDEIEIDFHRLSRLNNCKVRFFYCTVLGTATGIKNIESTTDKVLIRPAHILSNEYNLLSDDCNLFEKDMRAKIEAVLQTVAIRTGMTDDMSSADWRGYEGLGLSVGIRDMIPDASLAAYRLSSNDWTPLID